MNFLQKVIDKAYEKHPIIWQITVSTAILFIAFLVLWVAWQGTTFGGGS